MVRMGERPIAGSSASARTTRTTICVGQTYADLYRLRRDPAMIAPLRGRFDWILAHPRDDDLDFDETKNPDRTDRWSWCDALFMGPPAWLKLWLCNTGNRVARTSPCGSGGSRRITWHDRKEHLYYRASTQFAKREARRPRGLLEPGQQRLGDGGARARAGRASEGPPRSARGS